MSFIQSYQNIPFEDLQEEVEKHLQWAYAHGKLDLGELEHRLELLHNSSSKEELLLLVKDLPSSNEKQEEKQSSRPIEASEQETLIAFFSSNDRKGRWIVPREIQCHAFFGSIVLDLRDAEFPESQLVITGSAIFGSIDIIAPEHVDVSLSGLPFMGSLGNRARPVNPTRRVRFKGLALFGSVSAKTKKQKNPRQDNDSRQDRKSSKGPFMGGGDCCWD